MAAFTLSSDQRHLLGLLDMMALFDALLGKEGADRLMSRQGGGCGFRAPAGAPAWMTSYDTHNGAIISPVAWHGPPQVTVTSGAAPIRDIAH